jgi:hypothetical protein
MKYLIMLALALSLYSCENKKTEGFQGELKEGTEKVESEADSLKEETEEKMNKAEKKMEEAKDKMDEAKDEMEEK